jgi:ABC-type transport system involved in multi-copper enzyme maturation permease subunit
VTLILPTAGVLRSETLKALSVKTWWALAIPVAALALTVNVFGGLFGAAAGGLVDDGVPGILLASLAYALSLAGVFAAVQGVVLASAEFRHRTVSGTYLLGGRGPVLLAKGAVAAGIGAGYALVTAVVGLLAGLLGQGAARLPSVWPLLGVIGSGIAVCALWAVLGVALGTVVVHQAGAVVALLLWVLAIENLVSLVLRSGADSERAPGVLARITSYLPANAGDIALYDLPARALGGRFGPSIVETLAGVAGPPPGWGALLVLLVWTGAAVALAHVVGERRDIT